MKKSIKIPGLVFIIFFLFIFFLPLMARAQARQDTPSCPDLARVALDAAQLQCETTGRNEICYGHINLEASPQPGVMDFLFAQEGDKAGVTDVQTLRLSAAALDIESWGIALLRIQANLPDDVPADQNVTLVLFGSTEIYNTVPAVPLGELKVNSAQNANIRQYPSTLAPVLGTAAPGDTLMATGRLEDSSWVRVKFAPGGGTGWLSSALVSSESDLSELSVVDYRDLYYGPMQAFYFRSGEVQDVCAETPDGLVVQTPEGDAEISLLINEVDIRLGSTVLLRGEAGSVMRIDVLEGAAQVTISGLTINLVAGSGLDLPLGDDLKPAGLPGLPRAYVWEEVAYTPVSLLPREIEIAPPLDPAALAALIPEVEEITPEAVSVIPGEWGSCGSCDSCMVPGECVSAPDGSCLWDPATCRYVPPPAPIVEATDAPPLCPPDPTNYVKLQLTSMCSPDPRSYRVWRVRNENPYPVDFVWDVYGGNQKGTGTVPAAKCGIAGEASFNTKTIDGENTVRLFVNGVQEDAKASNPAQCIE
ncbi:MAG: SH3 domain-containing protein [Chloroflexi bacterium]|nr:SH3 domain-containing protein [Chloroflexota bacterium]